MTGWALGVPLAFDVARDVVDEFVALLPPGWTGGAVPDSAPAWAVPSASALTAVLSAAELYIGEHAPGLVAIHAGVVARDGRAIVLPGRTMSGKSTLTDALARAGATYYSDEFALLQPDGSVLPYPRPISLRETPTSAARRVKAEEYGPVVTGPARIAVIAQLRHGTGWSVATIPPARAVLALIDNAVAAQSRSAEVLTACAAAARTTSAISGTRGDAHAAAAELLAILDRR